LSPARRKRSGRLRRFAEFAFDAVLAGGTIARWSYRCGLHGRLGVTEYDVAIAPGPALPRPLKIAFASDFHAGPTTHPQLFAAVFDKLTGIGPDVLLLGGDFVSCRARYADELAGRLSAFAAPFGIFAVLGNHDLLAGADAVARRLTAAKVTVLVNRHQALPPPFDGVSICGVDDPWTGDADAARAFAGAAPIRIFLTHSPDGILLPARDRFDVGFAGHTHGGQIALPDGTPLFVSKGPLSRSCSHGRFAVAASGPLIVSRGIGCSNLPIRLNADSEIVVCTLR
jgi:predicted MPP superfamily phosphohydrolase